MWAMWGIRTKDDDLQDLIERNLTGWDSAFDVPKIPRKRTVDTTRRTCFQRVCIRISATVVLHPYRIYYASRHRDVKAPARRPGRVASTRPAYEQKRLKPSRLGCDQTGSSTFGMGHRWLTSGSGNQPILSQTFERDDSSNPPDPPGGDSRLGTSRSF